MSKRFVDEILEIVSECETAEQKIETLKKYNNLPLQKVLAMNYNPNVKFLIRGDVDYKPNTAPKGLAATNLYRESRRLYLYLDINGMIRPLSEQKRKFMYEMLLESLHAGEAEVLELARNRKLGEKYGLTLEIVNGAFPGMLPKNAIEQEKTNDDAAEKPKKQKRARRKKSESSDTKPEGISN